MGKEYALGASTLPLGTAPHPEPNMLNSYMTRYDYDYNREDIPGDFLSNMDMTSGYVRNRPLFARGFSGKDDKTIYEVDYTDKKQELFPGDMAAIAAAAATPHDLKTAQTRGLPSKAGCSWDEEPTISTYRDHFPAKWSTPGNGGAMYAGAKGNSFDPDFLRIDSLDDDGVGKSTKSKGGFAGGGSSDGKANGPSDVFNKPSRCHLGDNLTVFGPLNGDGQPWTTEYSTYGNPDLYKKQLLPTYVSDVPGAADNIGDLNKRRLLASLAGKGPLPPDDGMPCHGWNIKETNPISMTPLQADKCRVAARLENEGNVHSMSIYQSDYVNEFRKPELVDPPKDSGTDRQGAGFVTAKPETLPPKPMHPSCVRAWERENVATDVDRHVHKLRTNVNSDSLMNTHGDYNFGPS